MGQQVVDVVADEGGDEEDWEDDGEDDEYSRLHSESRHAYLPLLMLSGSKHLCCIRETPIQLLFCSYWCPTARLNVYK